MKTLLSLCLLFAVSAGALPRLDRVGPKTAEEKLVHPIIAYGTKVAENGST